MDPQDTIDLGREAIAMAGTIAGPMLLAGVVIGVVVGLLQAMTQVQDQTVSSVPKIVGMSLAALLTLPWISERMVDYTRDRLQTPWVGGLATLESDSQTPLLQTSVPRTPAQQLAFSEPFDHVDRFHSERFSTIAVPARLASRSSAMVATPGTGNSGSPAISMPTMRSGASNSMPRLLLPGANDRNSMPVFRTPGMQPERSDVPPVDIEG